LGIADPAGHDRGITALVEHGAVAVKSAVDVGDRSAKPGFAVFGVGVLF